MAFNTCDSGMSTVNERSEAVTVLMMIQVVCDGAPCRLLRSSTFRRSVIDQS